MWRPLTTSSGFWKALCSWTCIVSTGVFPSQLNNAFLKLPLVQGGEQWPIIAIHYFKGPMAAVIDINFQVLLCVRHYTINTTDSIFLFIVCILFLYVVGTLCGVIGDNRAVSLHRKKLWVIRWFCLESSTEFMLLVNIWELQSYTKNWVGVSWIMQDPWSLIKIVTSKL